MTRDVLVEGLNELLGFQVAAAGPDRVVIEWEVGPQHHQTYGIVHGGVHCAAVEAAASIGAGLWLGDRGRVVGVTNRTEFLRAVRDGRLTATATSIERSMDRQLWRVDIYDSESRLVACGQVDLVGLSR